MTSACTNLRCKLYGTNHNPACYSQYSSSLCTIHPHNKLPGPFLRDASAQREWAMRMLCSKHHMCNATATLHNTELGHCLVGTLDSVPIATLEAAHGLTDPMLITFHLHCQAERTLALPSCNSRSHCPSKHWAYHVSLPLLQGLLPLPRTQLLTLLCRPLGSL